MLSRHLRFCCIAFVAIFSTCGGNHGGPKSPLTVVSYGGGAYQESHKKAFCEPFAGSTGIPVNSVTWNADYGKLKAMVESGNVSWDVVDVTAAEYSRGKTENLFAKLSVTPNEGQFLPNSVFDDGVASVYWGTVLAYRKSAFPAKPPTTWADFWNVKDFPGPRAMYDDPRGNLEFALLADGVTRDKLYPLDVDRAFRKLDQIKSSVRVWWNDGTQPVQLLLNNSVVMSSAWNGRIYASEQARERIGYSFEGAALELDYWVIPRGSANQVNASQFIVFASRPENVGRQAELVGYGPVNITALNFVSEAAKPQLPTYEKNWNVSFVVDSSWWSSNEEKIKTRWLSWKGK
jgi:putative spermidine/putrescine transport system substrate-binding protein